jgi:hypothetical protein
LFDVVSRFLRQAFVFGGCLSPVPRPAVLRFKSAGGQGGLAEQLTKSLSRHIDLYKSFESLDNVQCFPLSDLLAALGVSHVDYLSLDVQGAEPDILRTIDFHKLRIDVIVVEVFDDDLAIKHKLSYRMKKFFDETKLYRLVMQTPIDMIFQRIDLDAPPGR